MDGVRPIIVQIKMKNASANNQNANRRANYGRHMGLGMSDEQREKAGSEELTASPVEQQVIKKVGFLIGKHLQYIESFKEQRRAFSRSWMRNGKEYNHPGMCMMIQEHRKKTAEKILRLAL